MSETFQKPPGWVRVELIISPDGLQAHPVGGDCIPVNPDVMCPFPGFRIVNQWLQAYHTQAKKSRQPADLHEIHQVDGPGTPSTGALATMLDTLPRGHHVSAVSINGQAGEVIVKTDHEGFTQKHKFPVK